MPKSKTEIEELVALEKLRHKNVMLEVKTETKGKKEIEELRFDHQMQLQRIKTAEIKKSMDRAENREFARNYPR
jgi:hypothetical protein